MLSTAPRRSPVRVGVIHWCIDKVEAQSPIWATPKKATRGENPRVELAFLYPKIFGVAAFGGVSAASLWLGAGVRAVPTTEEHAHLFRRCGSHASVYARTHGSRC